MRCRSTSCTSDFYFLLTPFTRYSPNADVEAETASLMQAACNGLNSDLPFLPYVFPQKKEPGMTGNGSGCWPRE